MATTTTAAHRWRKTRTNPVLGTFECSMCRVRSMEKATTPCLAARHSDPEINALYVARRRAAEEADGSGFSGMKGWGDLEAISAKLREVDPDGDWYYEGNLWDGLGWRVRRPEPKRVYWQQATTGKLHATQRCSIDRRTRYDHFRLELTREEASAYPLCGKCFTTDPVAPSREGAARSAGDVPTDTHTEGDTQMARTKQTAQTTTTDEAPKVEEAPAPAEAKVVKRQGAAKTADGHDLAKLLLDGLKGEGVKASKVVAPAGHYFRVVVDGKPIAYVNWRDGGAIRVEPKLEGNELPKTAKGFTKAKTVRQGLGYVGTFSDPEGVKSAVIALAAAAAKLAKSKEVAA